jgi:hypothetical protein
MKLLEVLASDQNICLSGAAGTGKTALMNHVITPCLQAMYGHAGVHITSTTSTSAALLEHGDTTYAKCGLGRGQGCFKAIIKRMSPDALSRWREEETGGVMCIVVDEFSMMSQPVFENLDAVARELKRCSSVAGGGVRMLFLGDACQIAPVHDLQRSENGGFRKPYIAYAFESPLWEAYNWAYLMLANNWRYGNDSALGHGLNLLRTCVSVVDNVATWQDGTTVVTEVNAREMPATLSDWLNARKDVFADRDDVLHLTCTKADAWNHNTGRMNRIHGHEYEEYLAVDQMGRRTEEWKDHKSKAKARVGAANVPDFSEAYHDMLVKEHTQIWADVPAARFVGQVGYKAGCVLDNANNDGVLLLKKGCAVVLTTKLSAELPTGTMGTVVGFVEDVDGVLRDEDTWDMGPGRDDNIPLGLKRTGVTAAHTHKYWPGMNSGRRWPKVLFTGGDGRQLGTHVMYPQWFSVTTGEGEVVCKRMQVPLVVGYALTVHRAQG